MLTLYFIKLNLYLSSPYISRVTQNQYTIGEAFVNVQFSVSAPAMNTGDTFRALRTTRQVHRIGIQIFSFHILRFSRLERSGAGLGHVAFTTLNTHLPRDFHG